MKNKFLPLLFLLLGGYVTYGQVGIGIQSPDVSAQLHVAATNKGVLIPNVSLQSLTSSNPILNNGGIPNSLLVFNSATAGTAPNNVTPGYYYWYDNKWNRIVISSEATPSEGVVIYNPTTNIFTYIDGNGNPVVIDFEAIVKTYETITTLVNTASGVYIYTSENNTATTIDVVADVINNANTILNSPNFLTELTTIIQSQETLTSLTYDPATHILTYTDEDGVPNTLNLLSLVNDTETLTTLVYTPATHTLTYTDENGIQTVIDLTTLDTNNINQTLAIDTNDNLALTDNQGVVVTMPVTDISSNNTFIDNLTQNSEFITNLTTIIQNHETLTSLTYNPTANTLTYTDEDGTANTLNLLNLVSGAETLTTLVYTPATHTLTYTAENGVATAIDLTTLDTNNINQTLAIDTNDNLALTDNQGVVVTMPVTDIASNTTFIDNLTQNSEFITNLTTIIQNQETLTSLTYNPTANTLTYTDEDGTANTLNLLNLVSGAETLTTLVYTPATHTLTYTAENGVATAIDLTTLDTNNINQTLAIDTNDNLALTDNQGVVVTMPVTDISSNNTFIDNLTQNSEFINDITNIITTEGLNNINQSLAIDTNDNLALTDNQGVIVTMPVADIASNNTFIDNLTQNSEFITNLTTIIQNQETLTSLTYNPTANTLTYTDEDGTANTLNLLSLVSGAETLTTLVYSSANGTLTYTDENGDSTVVDLTALINGLDTNNINQSLAITNDNLTLTDNQGVAVAMPVTAISSNPTFISNLVTNQQFVNEITQIIDAEETTTTITGTVPGHQIAVYTDEDGATTNINETVTALAYNDTTHKLVYTDEAGTANELAMQDLVGDAETLTTLTVNASGNSGAGSLDYKDEDGTTNVLDLRPLIKEPWFSVTNSIGATSNMEDVYTMGWVGIGHAAPSGSLNEKLRVNGAITTTNGYYADYVFEDYFDGASDLKADYKFKSLEETKAFINKNRHLPGITPITKLEKTKEGYSFNISELSIQSLEKIEELYLHIIEQQGQLDAKDQEIKALQERMDSLEKKLTKLGM
ncbi:MULTISPECIES: hypothetical protein [unclassified Flavobacterium]|uniref:hypothetical protein n=1 Tax=unclassified Flavobacterium TaxID=196869 RepID=UPI00095CEC3E|nr:MULTISPECIES: hypothetical protein [unclassified Flavobacterium]MBN9286187.1 hypothetical protein [Flavobacterium sp.]OJV73876.1 MAG: hypothetical protein BGO42_10295 [Flavobacterium sp. 40-81]